MRPSPAFLLTTLMLAGCGGGQAVGTPEAGRYEITVTVTRFDVPGLDAPKLHRMQSLITDQTSTRSYCLDPGQAAKKAAALFERIGEGACHLHDYNPRGGKVDVLMTCRALSGRQSFHLGGRVWPSGADIVASGVVTNPRFPQGQATLDRRVKMKRIADCKPSVAKPKKAKS